uniref:Uncharacterized protein LOC105061295 isoform X2 n=1 Tax=Elaeis guineensis var. tenera TaxID=51953 RepID=A0A8N4ESX6_ELAGV|nr:uncharacterized protein LOC105061295 isoform X2 [Elaeis guineensis]
MPVADLKIRSTILLPFPSMRTFNFLHQTLYLQVLDITIICFAFSAAKDAVLVRLVINALQGVKSALAEIEKLSAAFCSSPADRTIHRVPSLWCRSLSTNALGKILKSIYHSGLLVFFLQKFINFYLGESQAIMTENRDKDEEVEDLNNLKFAENLLRPLSKEVHHKNELGMHPPYSLVNQAFSVAVKKVLEGYFCAFGTLLASMKLRRAIKSPDACAKFSDGAVNLMLAVHSEITVLEVYLHTKELRTHIESLGNICFPKFADLGLSGKDLTVDAKLEFHNFPRGADLLTYLYVQLRDADPVHHPLLNFLFVHSFEPYYGFIKSWIYRATIDDPYEEFFVDYLPTSNGPVGSPSDLSLIFIKERDCVSMPCFLKDVCRPLLRAGQQLQVLVKLLNLCSVSVTREGAHMHCDITNIVEMLPYWSGTSSDSTFVLNSLAFTKIRVEDLMHKRDTLYKMMLERLQSFFSNFNVRNRQINRNVIPFASTPSLLGKRRDVNDLSFLASDEDFIFSGIADEEEAAKMPAVRREEDASYASEDSSYELEPLKSLECSSSYSSVEENEPEVFFRLHDNVSQPEKFLLSNLSTCYTTENILENSLETERSCSQILCQNNHSRMVPFFPLSNQAYEDEKLIQIPVPIQSGNVQSAKLSDSVHEGYHSGRCWPLGGLPKNPFYNYRNYMGPKEPHCSENSLRMTDGNTETPEREESIFSEVFIPFNLRSDTDNKVKFMNSRDGHLSLHIHKLWNSEDYHDLSTNPMVTKSAWFRKAHNLRNGVLTKNEGSYLPYFDFSSVLLPCKASSGSVFSGSGHGFQVEPPVVSSGVSAVQVNGISEGHMQDSVANLSVSSPVCSLSEENHVSGILPQSAFGGAAWVQSLQYSGEDTMLSSRETLDGSAIFEMPLFVAIDKCILQEILLQYKYVSNFTIKFLDEGFDLHEHLLALRRYHFMELADWADSFLKSLCNQKWSVVEPEQKLAEIQGLLELALQRSSCETDQYKERLFVYIKGQNTMPLSTSITGIHVFDFMLLGYRVDWPVSIIVTQDALKIYAEIFGYLVQVRLAVFSLADVWYCLKALMPSIYRSRHKNSHVMMDFNILMKMRQQINHFVSTLQQYVHSQLSDVSWCRFQHSLKRQVKDILDLESVHMSYLADALHICFLSVETKPVALIIKNILQCALDFRHCFTGGDLDDPANGADSLNLRSQMNFSQVFAIKTTFEKNIRDLYLLYLKSPKYGEFNFCRFWGYLNYNDYYSNTFNKEMGYFYMS